MDESHLLIRRRGLLLRTHMIRLVIKFVQDQLRHQVEILQATLRALKRTVLSIIIENMSSIKTLKKKAK
jgi:hypothetical protein